MGEDLRKEISPSNAQEKTPISAHEKSVKTGGMKMDNFLSELVKEEEEVPENTSLDSDEREFLDNISWDTESDEDLLIEDEAQCSDLQDTITQVKNKTQMTSELNDSLNEEIREYLRG